jgi:Domain of unknown function (DUF4258)
MKCDNIGFSRHAVQRMFSRGLLTTDVVSILTSGAVIEDYPSDFPYPSCLLLGWVGGRPVHVVAAQETVSGKCIVVTVYVPDPSRWSADFKVRSSI